MTNRMLFSMGVVGVAMVAGAADVMVGYSEVATNCVAGNADHSGLVSMAEKSTLYKTGEGTWTIGLGAFDSWLPSDIAVKNGTLVLDCEDAARRPAPAPLDAINAKALFWFDVSAKAEHAELFETRVVDDKTFLDRLYDVRETDTANRTRPCAVAEHVFRYVKEGLTPGSSGNCATSNNAEKILSPELVTRDGRDAIWFGGVGSGRRMAIHRAGKNATVDTGDVIHVFAVHDAPLGWGQIFAPGFRSTAVWSGTASSTWASSSSLLHCDDGTGRMGNRTYINGVRWDALSNPPSKGFSLFECDLQVVKVNVNRLFYNNSAGDGNACKIAADDDGSRATVVQLGGGDYVYELLAFTNALTVVERQQVVEYLRRKWFPPSAVMPNLACAEGTTVAVKSTTVATNLIDRSAEGLLVKQGSGDIVYARNTNDVAVQHGVLRLGADAGRAILERAVPIEVAPGMRVTADWGTSANETTVAMDAPAGTLVKEGKADLLAREVPESIRQINVDGGRLIVHPLKSEADSWLGSANDDVYIPIPNASFEDRKAGDESAATVSISGSPYQGWKRYSRDGSGGDSQQWIYNVDAWALNAPGMDGATRSMWGLTARPHDGASAMAIRRLGGVIMADPLELAAGDYELEYWSNTRGTSTGGLVDVVLVDAVTDEEILLARPVQMFSTNTGFGRVPLRFAVYKTGSYRLAFVTWPGADTPQIVVIDDLRLRRLAPRADATQWPIPGGDFEAVAGWGATAVTNNTPREVNTHEAWQLVQPAGCEGKTGTGLGVAFTCRSMFNTSNPYHNISRDPYQSTHMAFWTNGAQAVTTFTPPKGTWYLKGDLAEHGQSPNGTITAKVRIGDAETTLGSIDPNCNLFKTFRFTSRSFEADGVTPVTLTLTYALSSGINSGSKRAALFVDNLMLTRQLSDAKDGITRLGRSNFDNWQSPLAAVNNANGNYCGGVSYASYPTHGTDPIGGDTGAFLRFQGIGTYSHTFPRAGTYRLSIYVNRQSNNPGINPVRVWMAQGGITNELGTIRCGTTMQMEHVFTFRVPDSGNLAWKFGFQGLAPASQARDEYGLQMQDAILDNMIIAQVPDSELIDADDVFGPETEITVGTHGRLDLNFHGTNLIRRLVLGTRSVVGVVSSADHPDFLAGPGCLEIKPRGTVILFR